MWICLFFFFSSRRRHTRLQGDWSSDVCSSDLSFRERSEDSIHSGSEQSRTSCKCARGSRRRAAEKWTPSRTLGISNDLELSRQNAESFLRNRQGMDTWKPARSF